MPKGPKGQRRPADVIKNAVLVMKIATGETEEQPVSGRRVGGIKGAQARATKLTQDQRIEIAQTAANARWKKRR